MTIIIIIFKLNVRYLETEGHNGIKTIFLFEYKFPRNNDNISE